MPANKDFIDAWSAVHVTSGMAMGALGTSFTGAILLALAYDGAEQIVERTKTGQRLFNTKGPESLENVVGDMVFYSIGWWVGRKLFAGK